MGLDEEEELISLSILMCVNSISSALLYRISCYYELEEIITIWAYL